MEACQAVEKEVNKVLEKFTGLQRHYDNNLDELMTSIQNIQRELNEGKYPRGTSNDAPKQIIVCYRLTIDCCFKISA